MSATLQNNVRLRIFLSTLLSLLIRITRTTSSASVHKATGILETNFVLYGLIVIGSLLPFTATWIVAAIIQATALLLDISAISLGTLATYRCRTQTGCIQTLPMSIVSLILMTTVFVLDGLQSWDIYRIIRAPTFISSSTQRIRIISAWALPFGWMVNTIMVTHSEWSMFKYTTAHLIVDPLVILMANKHEDIFIMTIISTTIFLDILAWNLNTHTMVSKAILIQVALSIGALLILFTGKGVKTIKQETSNQDTSPKEFSVSEARVIRQRKSANSKIKF